MYCLRCGFPLSKRTNTVNEYKCHSCGELFELVYTEAIERLEKKLERLVEQYDKDIEEKDEKPQKIEPKTNREHGSYTVREEIKKQKRN